MNGSTVKWMNQFRTYNQCIAFLHYKKKNTHTQYLQTYFLWIWYTSFTIYWIKTNKQNKYFLCRYEKGSSISILYESLQREKQNQITEKEEENQNLTNIYRCNDAKLNTKLKIHYKLIIKWEEKKIQITDVFYSMKIFLLPSPLLANENANQIRMRWVYEWISVFDHLVKQSCIVHRCRQPH